MCFGEYVPHFYFCCLICNVEMSADLLVLLLVIVALCVDSELYVAPEVVDYLGKMRVYMVHYRVFNL